MEHVSSWRHFGKNTKRLQLQLALSSVIGDAAKLAEYSAGYLVKLADTKTIIKWKAKLLDYLWELH